MKPWLRLVIAAAAGVAVLSLPGPANLPPGAHAVFAVFACSVALWVLQVMNNGIASVLMLALLILAGVKPALAFSGFSSGQFWVLLSVLFYGFAMQRTGLAQRISYHLLSHFPATYPGVLFAFLLLGTVLSLGIPSMTVRTAILTPIAFALVRSVNLEPRSPGAALIVLSSIEMATIPGCGVLYGSLFGPDR